MVAGKKLKIGYWGIRGIGEYPKVLACYLGLEFEEVVYTSRKEWF